MSPSMAASVRRDEKSETRRLCPVQPLAPSEGIPFWQVFYPWGEGGHGIYDSEAEMEREYSSALLRRCRYRGEMYVRETTGLVTLSPHRWVYTADREEGSGPWEYSRHTRPSIHLKGRDARCVLVVLDVRVERVQRIDLAGVRAEGLEVLDVGHFLEPGQPSLLRAEQLQLESARARYASLWDRLHGSHPWSSNPYVYVVRFGVRHVKPLPVKGIMKRAA